jgi:hypothetical protein
MRREGWNREQKLVPYAAAMRLRKPKLTGSVRKPFLVVNPVVLADITRTYNANHSIISRL